MEDYIIGDQSRVVNYFLQGLDYYAENVLPKKQQLLKKIKKMKTKEIEKNVSDNIVYYAISTKKDSLEWLKNQLKESGKYRKIAVIVVDYFKDSSITSAYIKAFLERGTDGIDIYKIICVEFNESNHILMIEDEYNAMFSYSSLSRGYRKKIEQITVNRLMMMEENGLEEYYANRYMVRS